MTMQHLHDATHRLLSRARESLFGIDSLSLDARDSEVQNQLDDAMRYLRPALRTPRTMQILKATIAERASDCTLCTCCTLLQLFGALHPGRARWFRPGPYSSEGAFGAETGDGTVDDAPHDHCARCRHAGAASHMFGAPEDGHRFAPLALRRVYNARAVQMGVQYAGIAAPALPDGALFLYTPEGTYVKLRAVDGDGGDKETFIALEFGDRPAALVRFVARRGAGVQYVWEPLPQKGAEPQAVAAAAQDLRIGESAKVTATAQDCRSVAPVQDFRLGRAPWDESDARPPPPPSPALSASEYSSSSSPPPSLASASDSDSSSSSSSSLRTASTRSTRRFSPYASRRLDMKKMAAALPLDSEDLVDDMRAKLRLRSRSKSASPDAPTTGVSRAAVVKPVSRAPAVKCEPVEFAFAATRARDDDVLFADSSSESEVEVEHASSSSESEVERASSSSESDSPGRRRALPRPRPRFDPLARPAGRRVVIGRGTRSA